MMRTVVVSVATIVFVSGLLSIAESKPPQGKAAGAGNEHRSEKSLDASNAQKDEGAKRGLERAGERQSQSGAEHGKAHEQQAAKKNGEQGGWFDRAGKFLGIGRGDEKRSDEGAAHEKAGEQEGKKGAKGAQP